MRQLLLILMALTLVCLMVIGSGFAVLSDTETVTGNSITAISETVEDEGLSHGFWKNHTDMWERYSPGDLVGNTFDIPGELSELTNDTLIEALNYKGGKDIDGMARSMLLQSIAGLLNASNPECNYPIDEGYIVNISNNALSTLDRDTMEQLKDEFEMNNELGGDIDAQSEPIK